MNKPLFKKAVIIGAGLIGGSLGMALRKRGLAREVVAVTRRSSSVSQILKKKAAHRVALDAGEALEGADLVVLGAPVSVIARQLKTFRRLVPSGALVIDVGSSKAEICRAAKPLGKRFVGCHPMAGSEKIGVQNATENLFEGAICFVTGPDRRVQALWNGVGASTIILTPEAHDAWVAQVSHLPHLLSFALFQGLASARRLPVNPSVRAMARLSKSDAALWADIFLSNRKAVSAALKRIEADLSRWGRALSGRDRAALERFIREANRRSDRAFPHAECCHGRR